jgi:hypothetical protein
VEAFAAIIIFHATPKKRQSAFGHAAGFGLDTMLAEPLLVAFPKS